jgi:hypothetical protein
MFMFMGMPGSPLRELKMPDRNCRGQPGGGGVRGKGFEVQGFRGEGQGRAGAVLHDVMRLMNACLA